jgi:hypothetical protein
VAGRITSIKISNNFIAIRSWELPAYSFLLIRFVGGGVQVGPLGTSVTDWPIAPVPGDYDDENLME